MSALGLDETYAAIHDDVVRIVVAVDVVRVFGPDALSYLQGQVSQDLDPLGDGDSTEALVLSPQGKLDAFVRVVRLDQTEALVVVDDGFGTAVLERLRRFKVRVKADLELLHWRMAVVRGPRANQIAPLGDAVVFSVEYPGYAGLDFVGPDVALADGVTLGDAGAFEVARIEAGQPAMGREITERTIPQEAGIVERAVSLSKGCYTGQELVARIDARGNRVARRLVGLVADENVVAPNDALVHEGKDAGTVTSSAYSPRTKGTVALAYLRRDVLVPTALEVVHDGRSLTAKVSALPLYRA